MAACLQPPEDGGQVIEGGWRPYRRSGRDRDSSGEFDSIIANGTPSGAGRVTVRKGEIFSTQGCETWKKVG